MSKPRIWLIDDEERNHRALDERHGECYDIRHFYSTEELLTALDNGERPDLLLSDIFFLEESPEVGERLQAEAGELWRTIESFAERYKAAYPPRGLELAERLRREGRGIPNVVYSNKAPLLLDEAGFSRITLEAGPVWIFKGHESVEAERAKLEAVLVGARSRRRCLRLRSLFLIFILAGTLLGFVLGVLLGPSM